jgi:hypothetical protein
MTTCRGVGVTAGRRFRGHFCMPPDPLPTGLHLVTRNQGTAALAFVRAAVAPSELDQLFNRSLGLRFAPPQAFIRRAFGA